MEKSAQTMPISITRTKVILPRRRADLLTRPRLIDMLQDLLDEKLIIIAAPAGYGKTSLLIDLAYHTEMPTCWYAIDPLDREFKRFAAHLIASISQRFPTFGNQSLLALDSISQDDPDVNLLVTAIVNELYECVQEHFLFILDDYHFVNGLEPIDEFVSQLLRDVDENAHLAISSRTLLALPDLPLMVARSQVGGLGYAELAFRAEEIRQLVEQNYHTVLQAATAEELAAESEGWITGLLLSTQSRWQGMTDRLRVARVSAVGIYDYLAQQVLDQQPAPVRDFLLRTSILEEFDADLCEAVLGAPPGDGGDTWASLMDSVLRGNLFVLPVGEKGSWLRYHHLFRDFLQARLRQENPSEEARITRTLARVYLERGEWEKSHALYQRLGSTAEMIELIEQAGPALIRNGRHSTLAAWIDSLPQQDLTPHPVLLALRGDADMMQGRLERGLALLDHSVEAFRKKDDTLHLAQALTSRAHAHQFTGQYAKALADAEEVIQISIDQPDLLQVRAEALRSRGICLFRTGRWVEALDCTKKAIAIFETVGSTEYAVLTKIDLGNLYLETGAAMLARKTYENALSFLRKTGDLARQATVLNNLGVLHQSMGDYEQASALFEQSLENAHQSGYQRIEALALTSLGDLYRDLEAVDSARQAYERARQIAERIDEGFLLFYLHLAESVLLQSSADLVGARDKLNRAIDQAQTSASTYELGLARVEAGKLALAGGQYALAIEKLADAVNTLSSGNQTIEVARAQLYLAEAERRQSHEAAALAHLEQAFGITLRLDNRFAIVPALRRMKDLLNLATGHPPLDEPAQAYLSKIGEFESNLPILRRKLRRKALAVPFAPPKMIVRCLGASQVLMDGRPVPDFGSKSQAARDLFFLLIAHPEGMTKEAVGAFLWPECTPDQLKLRFKNAMYRLRRSLDLDVILLDGERYQFNRNIDYECDTEAFDHQLKNAAAESRPAEKIRLLGEAVERYKGTYLPDMTGSWIWPERTRLYQAYLNAALELAELYLASGENDRALAACQRLLAKDPCLEEAHRTAMRAYAGMGNLAAVVHQFELCRQSLMKEVNLPPSPQTSALFESLVG